MPENTFRVIAVWLRSALYTGVTGFQTRENKESINHSLNDMSEEFIWVLIVNIAASLLLTGMVWLIQLAGYPALTKLHRAEFSRHHRNLTVRSATIAAPVMIAELVTTIWLILNAETLFFYHLAAGIVVIILWLLTLGIHIPAHIRLQQGYDESHINRLSDANWLRIILWSAKSLISLLVLSNLMVGSA